MRRLHLLSYHYAFEFAIEHTVDMLLFYFATFLSCLAVVKTMAEPSKASIKSTETMRDSNDCYTPSTHINMMECENGNVGEKWGGCTDQDSVRVRCPKGTMPCNGLTNDKKEFRCMENCEKYKRDGGERTCLEKGILFLTSNVF